jgi:glutathione synthase/RimK-type ligase-like ATP-grasp enzyme
MWHFNQSNPRDVLFAKQLIFALQASGKKVFPDFYTAWHFDDKVAQKYLLESIEAPMVPSYVFYEKEKALEWIENTDFPKVFKLRRGAGSHHVKLVPNKKEAKKLVQKAFSGGFSQYNKWANLKDRWYKYQKGKTDLLNVLKGVLRIGYTTEFAKVTGPEKGYVYFQDFVPGNQFDYRVVVIGSKAFGIKRKVRENDFRASGSGVKLMNKELFDPQMIELAFDVTEKLNAQCVAFDFIMDGKDPKIVEISYGFTTDAIEGYWDRQLNWHQSSVSPQHWMIESLIDEIKGSQKSNRLFRDSA